MVDFTTLAGDDTHVNVEKLCNRAIKPLRKKLVDKLIQEKLLNENADLQVASVCIYPARVKDCKEAFDVFKATKNRPNIASTATGFPSGQYGEETKLDEMKYAIKNGANEIDMVRYSYFTY